MEVAICDLQKEDFKKTLTNSLINTGFAVLTHHDIDFELTQECQQEWRKFFKKPQSYKSLFINGNDSNLGYKGLGTETAVGAKKADLKEFFHWRDGEEIPESVSWVTDEMFMELNALGVKVLSAIDQVDGTRYAYDCYFSNKTLFRALYYPALSTVNSKDGSVRSAPHEDINYITLLVAASAPGLQVMDNYGKWHDVPCEENSIVVNVGDMLQLASHGKYRSTTHRVVNPADNTSDRISLPLFIHPNSHVELSPGYTAGQFLEERIAEIYNKK